MRVMIPLVTWRGCRTSTLIVFHAQAQEEKEDAKREQGAENAGEGARQVIDPNTRMWEDLHVTPKP